VIGALTLGGAVTSLTGNQLQDATFDGGVARAHRTEASFLGAIKCVAITDHTEHIEGCLAPLERDYVNKLDGKLTLHFLPGYAPDLNPDELVWSHAKRTGNARRPLLKGERLEQRVTAQLADIGRRPSLVRSFFRHPSVAYIAD
jgi:hypothetical protein